MLVDGRATLTNQILDLNERFFRALVTNQRDAWLTVELTIAQIKALLVIADRSRISGSRLARTLGVGAPSVTRLVARLCEDGLIEREEDAEDRRITYVMPTAEGEELVERLYSYKRENLSALLAQLNVEQLHDVQRALNHLARAAAVCLDEEQAGG
jgi:DNA-binding MarR family transcriptional regulator